MVALDEQPSRTNGEREAQSGNGIAAGTVNYIYYNSNWQAIETRTNGTAASDVTSQMVWSAAYINAAILQDTYSGGTIQPIARKYFLQDANWNTTAIVMANPGTGVWAVTQRYVYSPYGTITVLNADFSTPPAGTQPFVSNLYQGMTLEAVTGLYDERFRNYSPSLGTWISQDPVQYINGANTYQFVDSSPVGKVDASGLDAALPGVQKPVLTRTGSKHAMSGGRYYINYYYTQDLGLVITSGESPGKILLFRLANEILNGLTKLSGIGEIVAKIAKTITDDSNLKFPWHGTGYPEVTKVYKCKEHATKLQSVTLKQWRKGGALWVPDLSLHGNFGGGIMMGEVKEQDRSFLEDLLDTAKELKSSD